MFIAIGNAMKYGFSLILLGLTGCLSSTPVATAPTEQELAAQKVAELDAHIQETEARVIGTQGLVNQAIEQGLGSEEEIVTLKSDIRYFTFVVYSAKKERSKIVSVDDLVASPSKLSDEISYINNELILIGKCMAEAKDLGAHNAINQLSQAKDLWEKELQFAKGSIAKRVPDSSELTSAAERNGQIDK